MSGRVSFKPLRGSVHILAAFAILCAGCVAPVGPPSRSSIASIDDEIVIAIIDSGINPYHDAFHGWSGDNVSIPGATDVSLSVDGNYSTRFDADSEFWSSAQPGQLYSFRDQGLLGISFGFTQRASTLVDKSGHGTSVASLLRATAPRARIVVVQYDNAICEPNDPANDCAVFPPIADAMEWVAAQTWIDILQISQGFPANPPTPPTPDAERFLMAQQSLHDRGVLILNAAGNSAAPPATSYFGGPPWVISVGGYDGATRGESTESSKLTDVVANTTTQVPVAETTDEWEPSWGTSFATPIVAGVLAQASERLNVTTPSPETRERLRTALNHTAREIPPTSYDPSGIARDPKTVTSAGAPIVAPGAQGGWGLVDAGIIDAVVKAFLEGSQPRNAAQAATMAEYQAARERYWSQRQGGSEERPTSDDLPRLGVGAAPVT